MRKYACIWLNCLRLSPALKTNGTFTTSGVNDDVSLRLYPTCLLHLPSGWLRSLTGRTRRSRAGCLDPSGAVIAKALVRVVDQQTGTERKTETNESGAIHRCRAHPQPLQIFVQASGFSTAVSSPVTLNVGQNAVLDFTLHVGSSSEVVTVSASDSG